MLYVVEIAGKTSEYIVTIVYLRATLLRMHARDTTPKKDSDITIQIWQ